MAMRTSAEISPKLCDRRMGRLFRPDEPDAGPIPRHEDRAEKTSDGYRLTGSKMWISNAPIADVFVVWAKSAEHNNQIRGFILEKGMKGLSAPKIGGKLSLRASVTGEIVMEGVEVPESRYCPTCPASGPVGCPQSRPLRHLLGRDGSRGRLHGRARQYTLVIASSSTGPWGDPARAEELADMQTDIALGLQASLRVGRLMTKARWRRR